jgi:hypothetical protein
MAGMAQIRSGQIVAFYLFDVAENHRSGGRFRRWSAR